MRTSETYFSGSTNPAGFQCVRNYSPFAKFERSDPSRSANRAHVIFVVRNKNSKPLVDDFGLLEGFEPLNVAQHVISSIVLCTLIKVFKTRLGGRPSLIFEFDTNSAALVLIEN